MVTPHLEPLIYMVIHFITVSLALQSFRSVRLPSKRQKLQQAISFRGPETITIRSSLRAMFLMLHNLVA